jgi:hypothetical protein
VFKEKRSGVKMALKIKPIFIWIGVPEKLINSETVPGIVTSHQLFTSVLVQLPFNDSKTNPVIIRARTNK